MQSPRSDNRLPPLQSVSLGNMIHVSSSSAQLAPAAPGRPPCFWAPLDVPAWCQCCRVRDILSGYQRRRSPFDLSSRRLFAVLSLLGWCIHSCKLKQYSVGLQTSHR